MNKEEILQQIRKDREYYIKKQYSKSPLNILLRFFGASYYWHLTKLAEWEESLTQSKSNTAKAGGKA